MSIVARCLVAAVVLGHAVPVISADKISESSVVKAVAAGRVEDVRKLLEGSTPSAELLDKALVYAARANQVPSLEYLIDKGARPEGLNKPETGPLSVATAHGSKEAAEALVRCGVKPSLPAHFAGLGLTAELASYFDAHPKALDDLRHEEEYRHPLLAAAANGRIEAVDLLLKRGVSIRLADAVNITPLHEAVLHGRVEMVKHLLAAKADVEAKTKSLFMTGLQSGPHTPLNVAVGVNNAEIASLLLEGGAKLDNPPWTLDMLIREAEGPGTGRTKDEARALVRVLVANADKPRQAQLLTKALKDNDGLVLEGLLATGVDVAAALDIPPIHWCLAHAQPTLALMFIKNGADIRVVHDVGTPLGRAAECGYDEIVAELLARKADVDFGTTVGTTPLQMAVFYGNLGCVKLLLDAGADIRKVDAKSREALEKSKVIVYRTDLGSTWL